MSGDSWASAGISLNAEDNASGVISGIASSMEGLLGKLALGGIALESFGEIFKMVAEIGGKAAETFAEFTASMVEARAEHEKYEMQLATVFGRTMEWSASMEKAKGFLELVESASMRTGAGVDQLSTSFRSLSLLTGGSEQSVLRLTESLTVMARTAGMTEEALISVISRAALTGQLPLRGEGGRELALALHMTGEEIQAAYQTGELVKLLTERMGEMDAKALTLSDSWLVLGKSLETAKHSIMGTLGEAFEPLKAVLISMRETGDSDGLKGVATTLADIGKSMVAEKVQEFYGGWVAFKELLSPITERLAPIAAVFAYMRELAGSGDMEKLLDPIGRGSERVANGFKTISAALDGLIKKRDEQDKAEAKAAAESIKAMKEWQTLNTKGAKESEQYSRDLVAAYDKNAELIDKIAGKEEVAGNVRIARQADEEIRNVNKWERELNLTVMTLDQITAAHDTAERARDGIRQREKTKLEQWGASIISSPYMKSFLAMPDTLANGIINGTRQITEKLPTYIGIGENLVSGLWQSMSKGFDDLFYNVLSGKLTSLSDVFKAFGDSILKTLSQTFSDILTRWLATQAQMGGKWSGGASGNIYASLGGGSLLGGMAAGGMMGYAGGSLVGGMSGAPGFNTGAMIGGVVGGIGMGALSASAIAGIGAAIGVGAAAGTIVPILGTIIGAIIGGLIGVLSSPNTEMKARIIGASGDGWAALSPLGSSMGASALGIYGTAKLGDRAGFGGSVNSMISSFLRSRDYEVHAGSNEDMTGDFKTLMETVIPREMLHTLFGQKITGGKDMAGIGGASTFDSWVGADGPFVKMMHAVGFTGETIQKVADQIDTRAPQDFLKYLNSLVGVVVGFNSLIADLGKSPADWFAQFSADQSKGPGSQFTDAATNLVTLAGELSMYSGDEQIAKAQELLQLGAQYRDAQVTYLKQLWELQKSIAASVDDQVRGMKLDLLDPAGKKQFLSDESNGLLSQLRGATTAADVQRIMASIQGDMGAIWNLDKNADMMTWITQFLRTAQDVADQRIATFAADATNPNASVNAALTAARDIFTNMTNVTIPAHVTATNDDSSALAAHETATKDATAATVGFAGKVRDAGTVLGQFVGAINSGDFAVFIADMIRQNPSLLQNGTGS